jgi:hypothetical protein
MDAELNAPRHDLVRGWRINSRIIKFKMAAVNRKYLYLSTRLRYLINSKGRQKVLTDAELNGPRHDLVRGWHITGHITEFKMAAINRKYLQCFTGLRYLRNSKG